MQFFNNQAKRKQHHKHKDEVRKHAAQLFYEMLGQVCQKIFYKSTQMRYQEVPLLLHVCMALTYAFVIHGSHDILFIYYAKLPSEYLEAIARYSGKFREHYTIKNILRRSQRFHTWDTNQRVKFFRLLARLLFYLASGKSHCAYLFNYDDNPFHSLISPYSHFSLTGIDSQRNRDSDGDPSLS